MKHLIIFLLCFISVVGTAQNAEIGEKPENVILMIGDGMGLSQVSLLNIHMNDTSNFDRFSYAGLMKTSSATHIITDSGAAATSMATGVKTYNKTIGMSVDTTSVKNIPEYLAEKGMVSGLVVTCDVVHATPASFYAHVKSRYEYETIAAALPDAPIDFICGGGRKFFNNRKDGADLFPTFIKNGFDVYTSSLPKKLDARKNLILLAEDDMPTMQEGRGDFLPRASELAIESLSDNDNGFFLMIEGSQIDWGGHDMEPDYVLNEMMDFDAAIGRVLDFAELDGNTLVIVTADHETGALGLVMQDSNYNRMKPIAFSSDHTATMVPVFAFGPGAEKFTGVYQNNEIFHKIMSLLRK